MNHGKTNLKWQFDKTIPDNPPKVKRKIKPKVHKNKGILV